MPLAPGELLHNERYRIEALLGKGGFGEVYKAWDQTLDGYCAVKRNLNFVPEVNRQFQQEAKMLFKLRHPSLPRVYDYFEQQQEQYLVMDFIEGENLEVMVKRSGALPVEQALKWVHQVGEALIYLHNRQPPIIHRDIKPANLILTPEGQVVLVDFGIAKAGDIQQMTVSGARGVTPGFSPPEQYGMTGTDAQSDLYSLAATTYMLLTGQTPADAWAITLGEKPAPLPACQVNSQIPDGVSQAVESAMRLKRVERTRNVEQFLALLQSNAFPEIEKPPSKVAIKKEPEIFSLIEKKQKVRNPIRKDRAQSSTHRFVKPDPTSDSTHERRIDQFIEPELIRIPAGEFLMGSDKNIDQDTLDDEIPQHRMVLPEFWIGRYPVTNVEYQKFLLANPKQSTLEGWNGREYPIEKERHPVVNVTWYEAYAYCRWLTSIIGKQFVLPSEAEWEKAARGTDGRIYPWGIEWDSKRCNTSEKGPSMTTPVGMYTTKGDSPYGCSDMAGNVWQWTRSLFNQEKYPYPYTPNDGRESLTHQREIARVLRGGSFNLGSNYARCASRDWNSPGSRIWSYGFRVVYSPTFFQNSERRIS